MTTGDPRVRNDADLLFEVDPKSQVFDVVREAVTDHVNAEYGRYLATDDVRSVVHTNHIDLEPGTWHVDAKIQSNGSEMHVDLVVDADGDAVDTLTDYIEDEVEDRFGIDVDRMKYKKIRLRPGGWFVDTVFEGE